MKSIEIEINDANSKHLESSNLIISARNCMGSQSVIVVGFPGLPNEERKLHTGDAILYETPNGTYEVRVLSQNSLSVRFLITQITPMPSIAGAFNTDDPSNTPFSEQELQRISSSIEEVKSEISTNPTIQPEQIELVLSKLDEIKDAAQRLGRKDFITFTAGAITSTCISAAFSPAVTKSILLAINSKFSWLFTSAMLLLK